jgi:hypothetical protein
MGPKLYNDIVNRDIVAMIAQLRTGHCGLNHCLHRFGINRSHCEYGYGTKTMEYYLLECRNYKEPMKKLHEAVGMGK